MKRLFGFPEQTVARPRTSRRGARTFGFGLAWLLSASGCVNDGWAWWRQSPPAVTAMTRPAPPLPPPTQTAGHNQPLPPTSQQPQANGTFRTADPAGDYGGYPPIAAANQAAPANNANLPTDPSPSDAHATFFPVSTRTGGVNSPAANEFEPTRILARVGSEVVLAGDVLGPVNQMLAPYADKVSKEQLEQQRELLVRQQLKQVVEAKLMYLAFLREIPADKRDEALPKIWAQVHSKFDEEELPKALQRAKVETPAQLDAKLREFGWSIAKQRRSYGERQLGMSAAFQKIPREPEVTHQEMLAHFEQHADEYAITARARWEQLSVLFEKAGGREQALQQIQRMGNEVVLGGAPLWAVAKRDSHDVQASQGGQHDWTNQGSLASRPLDEAIFSLPIGELSPIIEDDRGFHIVRVLERRDAGYVPFIEAQVDIRKKLQTEKRQAEYQKYTQEVKQTIPVWTIFDEEDDASVTGH